jgi:hypothetical protein
MTFSAKHRVYLFFTLKRSAPPAQVVATTTADQHGQNN